MNKSIQAKIFKAICSFEKACNQYSKLIPAIDNLQKAKITMASMLDRIKQELNHLKNLLLRIN